MYRIFFLFLFAFITVSDCLAQTGKSYNNCPEPSRPFYRWTKVGSNPAGPPLLTHQDVLDHIAPTRVLADDIFDKAWHKIAMEEWSGKQSWGLTGPLLQTMWDAAQQGEGTNLVHTEYPPCTVFADMIQGIPNRPVGMAVLYDPIDGKPLPAWVWKVSEEVELGFADACRNVVQKVTLVEEKPDTPVVTQAQPETTKPEPQTPAPPQIQKETHTETRVEKETVAPSQPSSQAQGQIVQVNVGGDTKPDRIEQPTLRTIARRQHSQVPIQQQASGVFSICNMQGKAKFEGGRLTDFDGKCHAGAPGVAQNVKDFGIGIGTGSAGVGAAIFAAKFPGAYERGQAARRPNVTTTTISNTGVSSPSTTTTVAPVNTFAPDIANNNNPVANANSDSSSTSSSESEAVADSDASATSNAQGGAGGSSNSVVVDRPPTVIVVDTDGNPVPGKNPFTPPPNPGGRPQNN